MTSSSEPRRRSALSIVVAVIGFTVLFFLVFLVALYLFAVLGPHTLFLSLLLAGVPLVVVLFFIRWIDRWEPEPRLALLFAFLWGAAASVGIALVFSSVSQEFQQAAGIAQTAQARFFATVIQAPVVEESAKGFGILLLLWALRRTFDGPVDGLVYGATIAVGFAFTENLQYFGLAIISDKGLGGDVAQIFVLRAVLSPFAHVMFTACTGLLLGLAARRTGRLGAVGYFLVGLVPAVFLHAFWNSANYWASNWFGYYFFVQVPLFVLAIIVVISLRRHEQILTRRRLSEYAAMGWFTPAEVNLLSTGAGRRYGIACAARSGLAGPYRRFVAHATRLAFARQRMVSDAARAQQRRSPLPFTGKVGAAAAPRRGSARDESFLLAAITADRAALASLPPLT